MKLEIEKLEIRNFFFLLVKAMLLAVEVMLLAAEALPLHAEVMPLRVKKKTPCGVGRM